MEFVKNGNKNKKNIIWKDIWEELCFKFTFFSVPKGWYILSDFIM